MLQHKRSYRSPSRGFRSQSDTHLKDRPLTVHLSAVTVVSGYAGTWMSPLPPPRETPSSRLRDMLASKGCIYLLFLGSD